MNDILNIISDSIRSESFGGPQKVIRNTLKGLDLIGYPYVLNKDPRYYNMNWIHDSVRGFIEIALLGVPSVIGPNLAVLPSNLPGLRPKVSKCIYLHPSQWCIDLWKIYKFNECPLLPWPAGIDTDDFNIARSEESRSRIMVYFKRRDPVLLNMAVAEVEKAGLEPVIVKYGEYNEKQYKEILARVQFGIWIGISESQGIGLQEALASGLPLIVLDIRSLFESSEKRDHVFKETVRSFRPTSVPYFDKSCGKIIFEISDLGEAISTLLSGIHEYNPRSFIERELSLRKQAQELISFFDKLKDKGKSHFILSEKEGTPEKFRLSQTGKLIYIVFVIGRKFRTFIRMAIQRIRFILYL